MKGSCGLLTFVLGILSLSVQSSLAGPCSTRRWTTGCKRPDNEGAGITDGGGTDLSEGIKELLLQKSPFKDNANVINKVDSSTLARQIHETFQNHLSDINKKESHRAKLNEVTTSEVNDIIDKLEQIMDAGHTRESTQRQVNRQHNSPFVYIHRIQNDLNALYNSLYRK